MACRTFDGSSQACLSRQCLRVQYHHPATAELDDAAAFEIVEDGGGGLTCGADQARNIVMGKRNEIIGAACFNFRSARGDLVQEFAHLLTDLVGEC